MKTIDRLCILGLLAAVLVSCASTNADRKAAEAPSPLYGSASRPSNQIVVTFQDERLDRVPVTDPANSYRQRGNYSNSTWSKRVADGLAEDYGLRAVTQWPINTLGIHCVVFEVPGNQSLDQILKRLGEDSRVEAVQPMKQFNVMAEAYDDPYYKLQNDARAMHIDSAHRIATGRNIKIAVIDTGVDVNHPDLAGQVSQTENFVKNSPTTTDDIHGTAVAGVIAATANNHHGIVGMAPGSKLIALKACWQNKPQKPEASCNTLTLALALDSAIKLKVDIINMSLTGPSDPLLERLIDKASAEGIILVASQTANKEPTNEFPASMKQVVAVRTAGPGRTSIPLDAHTVSAPGVDVLTTLPYGTYNFMTGSSFAAAHVSGLIALLRELNPRLSSGQIVSILNASMNHSGNPRELATIDACSAVASVRGLSACSG